LIAAVALLAGFALSAGAATVPVGFNDRQIATGFTSPTALTVLPDGRVLAMQQNGIIRIVKGDVLLAANFWGVPNVDSTNERGCLGTGVCAFGCPQDAKQAMHVSLSTLAMALDFGPSSTIALVGQMFSHR